MQRSSRPRTPPESPARAGIEIKSPAEIALMRAAGKGAAEAIRAAALVVRPGASTLDIDRAVAKAIASAGMQPAFLGYRGYPATACVSVNNELVHGIPSGGRVLSDGDIVSVDLGVIHQGYYGDITETFFVGAVPPRARRLVEVTNESLRRAIAQMRPGARLGDVSWAVQSWVEENGFGVVRDYVGHGIGRRLHEEPAVPNFGRPGTGVRLEAGMVLAIEPMVTLGSWEVKTLSDGWTVVTVDGGLCAHVEHTVAVTADGYEVLTAGTAAASGRNQ